MSRASPAHIQSIRRAELAVQLIRRLLRPLKNTPLHPQWLSYRDNVLKHWLGEIVAPKRVLDIGCFDRWPSRYLNSGCDYIGIDYFSPSDILYTSQVNCYGDAQKLPFESGSFDAVLLFDVLEHIPNAHDALQEIHRVLKSGGELFIQIPFLYPIHDAPFDYHRPTRFGLEKQVLETGFRIVCLMQRGQPLETAVLTTNIAMASTINSLLTSKWALMGLTLLPIIGTLSIALNLLGWVASKINCNDQFMPFSYQCRCQKTS